jgi:integrase/recombinase XerD
LAGERIMSATPTWAARVEAYLAYRRSFGFELSIKGGQLGSFARFADQRGAERLTLELATDWARASRYPRPLSWVQRIEVLRGFAAFCLRTDPDTVVPPPKLFGPAHRRLVPHIYTAEELCNACWMQLIAWALPAGCARPPAEPSSGCWQQLGCVSPKRSS